MTIELISDADLWLHFFFFTLFLSFEMSHDLMFLLDLMGNFKRHLRIITCLLYIF